MKNLHEILESEGVRGGNLGTAGMDLKIKEHMHDNQYLINIINSKKVNKFEDASSEDGIRRKRVSKLSKRRSKRVSKLSKRISKRSKRISKRSKRISKRSKRVSKSNKH